ncbi:hypothetical protein EV586_103171 [Tumebacillus sp. BK434]|uniref:hypothetical protein n=1 Tax=Tumebacillus sp. BK434 TaxID=2512169 RepID=UPI0010DCCA6D|nr:hypothetical protein [Tumebacillus sp. BK434]TCP55518.1 hypothetical protein EV586_103171 [Tumebacillus sp. BK434]
MVIPKIIIQLCLMLVIARCGYVGFQLINHAKKKWLEILFHFAVAIIALDILL